MKKIYFLPVMALLLAACDADDQSLEGSLPAPETGTTTENVVSFTNNTAMVIGRNSTYSTSMLLSGVDPTADNAACVLSLDPDKVPAIPSDAYELYSDADRTPWQIPAGASAKVSAGETVNLSKGSTEVYGTLYVSGTVNVDKPLSGSGQLIVLPGGKAIVSHGGFYNGFTVLNYGELEFTTQYLDINQSGTLMTVGDIEMNGTIAVGGKLYAEGDVKCVNINPYQGSVVHVGGNLTTTTTGEVTYINNNVNMCVDGTMETNELSFNSGANLHVGCKLLVNKLLNVNNRAVVCTSYIKTPKTTFTAGSVYLTGGGVAELGELHVEAVPYSHFYVAGDGNALVSTTATYLHEQYSLTNVIPANIYFNYEHFYIVGAGQGWTDVTCPGSIDGHEITIGTQYVNVATINASSAGQCSPGFTGKDDPTPGQPDDDDDDSKDPTPGQPDDDDDDSKDPTPGQPDDDDDDSKDPTPGQPGGDDPTNPTPDKDGDIELVIPDDVDNDWFLTADDFAIRIDGAYVAGLEPVDKSVTIGNVTVSESGLSIAVTGVKNLEYDKEYTYEVYLWVSKESWKDIFSEADRKNWVSGDGYGTNISKQCKVTVPDGYTVRYDVYKGLSGKTAGPYTGVGDTPYMKVSIHVNRERDTK